MQPREYKLVYYGRPIGGKTMSLQYLVGVLPEAQRSELREVQRDGARLLTFTFEPAAHARFHVYTLPGCSLYPEPRRRLLHAADGVAFVADSLSYADEDNRRHFREMVEVLSEQGRTLDEVPVILQYNKRDLPDVMALDELEASVNLLHWPAFETSALRGMGVLETFEALCSAASEKYSFYKRDTPYESWSEVAELVQAYPAPDDPSNIQPFGFPEH